MCTISCNNTICNVYVQFIIHLDVPFLQSVYYYLLLGKEGYLMLPFDKKKQSYNFCSIKVAKVCYSTIKTDGIFIIMASDYLIGRFQL